MTTQTRDITRRLIIEMGWNEPLSQITLELIDGSWEVHDSKTATLSNYPLGSEAAALRAYADHIEALVNDEADEAKPSWKAAITRARKDATALDAATR